MNLKAVKASYGDFGRVQRGTILKDISRDLGEKLIKSGAYVEATAADTQQADKQRELPNTHAELNAQKAKAAAELKAKEEAAQKAKAAVDAKVAAEPKTSGQK
jgi:hypothetical protein